MEHYIFDLDGTLGNTKVTAPYCLETYCKHAGLKTYNAALFQTNYTDVDRRDIGFGVPLDQQRAVYNQYNQFISMTFATDKNMWFPVFDGIVDLLESLHQANKKIHIATSRDRSSTDALLDHNNIRDYFSTIVTATCMSERKMGDKPHGDMVKHIMMIHGITNKTDVVMIGDTEHDMVEGLNAGVMRIGVTYGSHGESQLLIAGANHIVHSRPQLKELALSL